MWIKEVIIEGFKSYATRTVISNFDPEFNAITGLNGSGKSNILDAILFCLGLSKEYETLRIKKLQELIYKNGAAGITKAEVTIVFDNRAKDQSPLGYQDCDKIVVTRQITIDKSKYFINGKSETQKNFKNMFRSVQINIDNPHFLVAQGRITKIINLKPQELIGMLEETAGTSLYNEKKREAQKLIQKKEEKLKQVTDIIEQEIQPQMHKLLEERHTHQMWKAQEAEIQRLKRELYAYEYHSKAKALRMKKQDQQILTDQISKLEDKTQFENAEIRNLEESIQKKIEENKGNQYQQIEAKYKELSMLVQKLDKNIQGQKKTKETIENDKIKLEQTVKTLEAEIERITQKKEFADKTLNQMKNELHEKKETLDEQQRQKQQSQQTTYEDANQMIQKQIRDTEAYLHSHKGDFDQVVDRIRRIDDKMESSKKLFETSQKDSANLEQRIAIMKKEIEQMEKELEGSHQLENEIQFLKQQRSGIDQNILECKNRINQQPAFFTLNLSRMVDWDRKRVYGRVFSLFDVKDESCMKALEFGAGAKLSNIVVDDHTTSAYMLNKNILQQYANFIPNKEINALEMSEDLIRVASQVASENGGFAKPALQLISYPDYLERSMKFVFGNFLVASNMEIANKIAYHTQNKQKLKVVTKDGDIVDPSGTITGGYSNEKNLTLPRQKIYNKLIQELNEEQKKLEELEKRIQQKHKDSELNDQLRQTLQEKKYQLEQLQIKQKRSSNFQFQTEQQKLMNERKDLEAEQGRLEQQIKTTESKLKELIQDQKQMQKGKDTGQLINQQIERNKKEIEKLKQNIDKYKQDVNAMEVDIENCQAEIQRCHKKIESEVGNLSQLNENLSKVQQEHSQTKEQFLKIQDKKLELESKNQIYSNQVNRLKEQLSERLIYRQQTAELLEANQQELKKLEREVYDLHQQLKQLEDKNDFIRLDKQELGSDQLSEKYQFIPTFEYEKMKQTFQRLEHEQGKLEKMVNFNVDTMTEQVEKEFKQLQEKKLILQNDKTMLIQNMGELDDKKIKTIEKCFLEVNKTFSAIFSSLLPNAQARLGRLEGLPIEEGIEMIVSFSHQPKNLSELSGGQRSLLALSFILGLLKYEPAPFYILDEVDSALDLSHTENIGQMLAQNFKQSQFILISLKEGMYQNANVLYKVSFVDGVSKVERQELKQKKKHV